MSNEDTNTFTGFLVSWEDNISRQKLLECEKLSFSGTLGSSNWEKYIYLSNEPLRKEDEEFLTPPYKYPLICRRSGPRFLLLSNSKVITEFIIEREFSRVFMPYLRKINITVDNLVKDLTRKPTVYVLTFVHTKLPAYGALLRSASFYGDDIGEASFFRESIDLMNCYTCGLRSAVGGTEIVRLGNEGTISFIFNDIKKILEVEKVLAFLRKQEYLEDNYIDNEKGKTKI